MNISDLGLFAANFQNPSRIKWTKGRRLRISERSAGSIQHLRLELHPRGILDVMPTGKDAPQLADDALQAITALLDLSA